uniref:Uncharacterized protein n=1 Tax=Parascaris univalens TaxID=6257 RepID=A0A915A6U5_PARUN
ALFKGDRIGIRPMLLCSLGITSVGYVERRSLVVSRGYKCGRLATLHSFSAIWLTVSCFERSFVKAVRRRFAIFREAMQIGNLKPDDHFVSTVEGARVPRNNVSNNADEQECGNNASSTFSEIRRGESLPSGSSLLHPQTSATKSDQWELRPRIDVKESAQWRCSARNLTEISALHRDQNLARASSQSVSNLLQLQRVKERTRKGSEVSRSVSRKQMPPKSASNHSRHFEKRMEFELADSRKQLVDAIQGFEIEREGWRAQWLAEAEDKIEAIVRVESAKGKVCRLKQQLQEAGLSYDMKEIELRMTLEEIINFKLVSASSSLYDIVVSSFLRGFSAHGSHFYFPPSCETTVLSGPFDFRSRIFEGIFLRRFRLN